MTDLEKCDYEMALATFAILTGRDPVNCQPISVDQALLYYFDWQHERAVLTAQEPSPNPRPKHLPVLPRLLDSWLKHPCSTCDRPGAQCSHRAPVLADVLALVQAVVGPATPGSTLGRAT